MKLKELKERPIEDLKLLLKESKEKLRSLKFDLAAGKVKNVRQIRMFKKNIARILTILRNQDKYEK